MQERLAQYMHENDPIAPYDQPWETLPEVDRDRYRSYAYAAINFYRESVFLPPVMPRWFERETA